MSKQILTLSVVLGSMTVTSVAHAQSQNMVNGLLNLGGAIILNEALKRQQPQPAPQRTAQPAPQRGDGGLYSGTAGKSRAQVNAETVILRQEIQRRLNMLGLDAGDPDGIFGPRSRRAISTFQRQIGERATGSITESQINRLYEMTGGHPSVAGPAGPAVAAAFPPLAGAGNPQGATGFPALAGAPAPAAAPAFPPLGGGQAPGAPTPAFPALADAGASEPVQPAFPAIGPGEQSAAVSPAFPALASPGPGAQAPAFPALAPSAPGQADAAFPQLAAASAPPSPAPIAVPLGPDVVPSLDEVFASIDPAQLEAAVLYGAMPFGTEQEQPRIFGAAIGDQREAAIALFQDAGFTDCAVASDAGPEVCTRGSDTAQETVSLRSLPDGRVWQIARKVQFKQPIENALLIEQMRTPYPDLVETGIAATPSCTPDSVAMASTGVEAIAVPAAPVDLAVKPDVVQAIVQCPLTYQLHLSDDERSEGFELVFTHGAALVLAVLQEQDKLEQEEQRRMTEVTKSLTF